LTESDTLVKKLDIIGLPDGVKLYPHGISFFMTKRNEELLFVVDHQRDGEYVQIFEYKKEKLFWRYNVTDPLFTSLNDVVAFSNTSFYVTNDHHFPKPYQILEDIVGWCGGSVLYYDGKNVNAALVGLCVPNGINSSPDLGTIYLAESQAGTLTIFQRDRKTLSLTPLKKLELEIGIDNIDVNKNVLTVGGHRSSLELYAHVISQSPCPSSILRITLDSDLNATIDRLYGDDGRQMSAVSVGIVSMGKLIMGVAMSEPLMVCENVEVTEGTTKDKVKLMKEISEMESQFQKGEASARNHQKEE